MTSICTLSNCLHVDCKGCSMDDEELLENIDRPSLVSISQDESLCSQLDLADHDIQGNNTGETLGEKTDTSQGVMSPIEVEPSQILNEAEIPDMDNCSDSFLVIVEEPNREGDGDCLLCDNDNAECYAAAIELSNIASINTEQNIEAAAEAGTEVLSEDKHKENSSLIPRLHSREHRSFSAQDMAECNFVPLQSRHSSSLCVYGKSYIPKPLSASGSSIGTLSVAKSRDSGIARSVSCTSLRSHTAKYDHIGSKVKEYIRQIKSSNARDKSISSFRRSSSPLFLEGREFCPEFLREECRMSESNLEKYLDTLSPEKLLTTMLEDRKKLQEKEKMLEELQKNYDDLLARYAEAENKIDILRFERLWRTRSQEYEINSFSSRGGSDQRNFPENSHRTNISSAENSNLESKNLHSVNLPLNISAVSSGSGRAASCASECNNVGQDIIEETGEEDESSGICEEDDLVDKKETSGSQTEESSLFAVDTSGDNGDVSVNISEENRSIGESIKHEKQFVNIQTLNIASSLSSLEGIYLPNLNVVDVQKDISLKSKDSLCEIDNTDHNETNSKSSKVSKIVEYFNKSVPESFSNGSAAKLSGKEKAEQNICLKDSKRTDSSSGDDRNNHEKFLKIYQKCSSETKTQNACYKSCDTSLATIETNVGSMSEDCDKKLAKQQTKFDCWMPQISENKTLPIPDSRRCETGDIFSNSGQKSHQGIVKCQNTPHENCEQDSASVGKEDSLDNSQDIKTSIKSEIGIETHADKLKSQCVQNENEPVVSNGKTCFSNRDECSTTESVVQQRVWSSHASTSCKSYLKEGTENLKRIINVGRTTTKQISVEKGSSSEKGTSLQNISVDEKQSFVKPIHSDCDLNEANVAEDIRLPSDDSLTKVKRWQESLSSLELEADYSSSLEKGQRPLSPFHPKCSKCINQKLKSRNQMLPHSDSSFPTEHGVIQSSLGSTAEIKKKLFENRPFPLEEICVSDNCKRNTCKRKHSDECGSDCSVKSVSSNVVPSVIETEGHLSCAAEREMQNRVEMECNRSKNTGLSKYGQFVVNPKTNQVFTFSNEPTKLKAFKSEEKISTEVSRLSPNFSINKKVPREIRPSKSVLKFDNFISSKCYERKLTPNFTYLQSSGFGQPTLTSTPVSVRKNFKPPIVPCLNLAGLSDSDLTHSDSETHSIHGTSLSKTDSKSLASDTSKGVSAEVYKPLCGDESCNYFLGNPGNKSTSNVYSVHQVTSKGDTHFELSLSKSQRHSAQNSLNCHLCNKNSPSETDKTTIKPYTLLKSNRSKFNNSSGIPAVAESDYEDSQTSYKTIVPFYVPEQDKSTDEVTVPKFSDTELSPDLTDQEGKKLTPCCKPTCGKCQHAHEKILKYCETTHQFQKPRHEKWKLPKPFLENSEFVCHNFMSKGTMNSKSSAEGREKETDKLNEESKLHLKSSVVKRKFGKATDSFPRPQEESINQKSHSFRHNVAEGLQKRFQQMEKGEACESRSCDNVEKPEYSSHQRSDNKDKSIQVTDSIGINASKVDLTSLEKLYQTAEEMRVRSKVLVLCSSQLDKL